MPTIEATVSFRTSVNGSETKGLGPYNAIKSRISKAREIEIIYFKIIEDKDPEKI
jgi:hypothetical protein